MSPRRCLTLALLCLAGCAGAEPRAEGDKAPRPSALLDAPLFGVSPVPFQITEAYTPGGLASARAEDLLMLHEQGRYTFARGDVGEHPWMLPGSLIDAQSGGGGQDALHALTPLVEVDGQAPLAVGAAELRVDEDTRGGALLARGAVTTPQGERLEVETRAVLRRELPHLLLTTTVTNRAARPMQVALGDRLAFGPGELQVSAHGLLLDARGQAYGYTVDAQAPLRINARSRDASPSPRQGPVEALSSARALAPGESASYTRRFLASASGAAGVQAWWAALRPGGAAPGRLQVALDAPYGMEPEDFQVDLYRQGQRWSALPVRSGLVVDVELPAGRYQVVGQGAWGLVAEPAAVEIAPGQEASAALRFPRTGEVLLRLKDARGGAALAGAVLVQRADGAPVWLGDGRGAGGAGPILWLPRGEGALRLPPGRYRLTASRGPEYGLATHEVEVQADQKSGWEATLARAITTPGELLVDPRAYALGGLEGATPTELLSGALIGQGVEVAALADPPERPGGRPRAPLAVPGLLGELPAGALGSPDARLWPPLEGAPAQIQLVELWSGDATSPLAPRGTSADGLGAALLNERRAALRPRLEQGQRFGLLAASGAASLDAGPPGLPALWVQVGERADSPDLDPARVALAIEEGRTTLTSGPWAWLQVEGRGPGALVPARQRKPKRRGDPPPPPEVSIRLDVRAPAWMEIERAFLLQNDQPIKTWEIPRDGDASLLQQNLTLPLPEGKDTWLQLLVVGTKPLATAPHKPTLPFALTSPIYINTNRDAEWKP
jgi:hypothetical protein